MNLVYVVGKVWRDGSKQWEIQGVFSTEAQAQAACFQNDDVACFVGPLELDAVLPREKITWPGAYYPAEVIR